MGMRTSHDSIFTKSEVPGPGTYQPGSTLGGVKYTIKGRTKIGTQIVITPDNGHEKMTESNEFNVPGPGTYTVNTSLQFKNLSTIFKLEERPDMGLVGADKIPAPNAYRRDANAAILKS